MSAPHRVHQTSHGAPPVAHQPTLAFHHSGRAKGSANKRRSGKDEEEEEEKGKEGAGQRVKCREDSDERQLSCTSAHPGAPVSRRTCKACRSSPDNPPRLPPSPHASFSLTHTHSYARTHTQRKGPIGCSAVRKAVPFLDSVPVKLSLALAHMQGELKTDEEKKTRWGSRDKKITETCKETT